MRRTTMAGLAALAAGLATQARAAEAPPTPTPPAAGSPAPAAAEPTPAPPAGAEPTPGLPAAAATKDAPVDGGPVEKTWGLVVEAHLGSKGYDSPDVRGPLFGAGVRFVDHEGFRMDIGLRVERGSLEHTVDPGFPVTQAELGIAGDFWGGLGLGPVDLLLGLGLGARSVSGEIDALGKPIEYASGWTGDFTYGAGVAVTVSGFRPVLRYVGQVDLGADEEAVEGGSVSGGVILVELGWEALRW